MSADPEDYWNVDIDDVCLNTSLQIDNVEDRGISASPLFCLGHKTFEMNNLAESEGSGAESIDEGASFATSDRSISAYEKQGCNDITSSPFGLMNGLESPEQELEMPNDQSCLLCHKVLTEPRVLACLHTFCELCLIDLFGTRSGVSSADGGGGAFDEELEPSLVEKMAPVPPGYLRCPTCKQESYVGSMDGIKALLPDFVTIAQQEAQAAERGKIACNSCKTKEKAVARCSDCANFLCPNCVQAHQFMRCFENHKVVSFDEMRRNGDFLMKIHKPVLCPAHPTERMKYYCSTCQLPVCNECMVVTHKPPEHQHEKISSDIEKRVREDLERLLTDGRARVSQCHDASKQLDDQRSVLVDRVEAARAQAVEMFDEFRSVLEECKTRLLADLDAKHMGLESQLVHTNDAMSVAAERIEDAVQFSERLLNNANVIELLSFKKLVFLQLRRLMESVPSSQVPLGLRYEANKSQFEQAVRGACGGFYTTETNSNNVANGLGLHHLMNQIGMSNARFGLEEENTSAPGRGGLLSPTSYVSQDLARLQMVEHGKVGQGQRTPSGDSGHGTLQNAGMGTFQFLNVAQQIAAMGSGSQSTVLNDGFHAPLSPALSASESSVASTHNQSDCFTPFAIAGSSGVGGTVAQNARMNSLEAVAGSLAVNLMAGAPSNIGGRAGFGSSSVKSFPPAGPPRVVSPPKVVQPPPPPMDVFTLGIAPQYLAQQNMGLTGGFSGPPPPIGQPPSAGSFGQPPLYNMAAAVSNPPVRQSKCNPMQIRFKLGSLGPGKCQFNSPHGFCLGQDEDIVVADTNNHRIQIFDKNGEFRYQFGIPGKDEGQLFYPRKVAVVKSSGKYVVCDRGSERSRMQIFTKNGHFVKKIAIRYVDIVAGLAITESGCIVAVDSVSPTVFVIEENGELKHWFDCSDYMREPSDIAVSKGEYYVCDFKGHCVVVFSETGNYLRRIGCENITNFPNGIDISDFGDVLVGDSHGNRFHVAVFQKDGSLLSEFECPYVKVSRCCGLKITSEGFVVTLAKNNHHLLVLNTLYINPAGEAVNAVGNASALSLCASLPQLGSLVA